MHLVAQVVRVGEHLPDPLRRLWVAVLQLHSASHDAQVTVGVGDDRPGAVAVYPITARSAAFSISTRVAALVASANSLECF